MGKKFVQNQGVSVLIMTLLIVQCYKDKEVGGCYKMITVIEAMCLSP